MSLRAALLLLPLVALAACARQDPFATPGGGPVLGPGPGVLPSADVTSTSYFRENVGDRVLFSVDQSTLDAAARATLAGQAQWLAANPEYAVVIEGHADEQGTREYNLALGARRSNAVQEYLVSQGVAPVRVRTVSYGKERPIEVCSEEACYARNRRAVTVLSAGAGF